MTKRTRLTYKELLTAVRQEIRKAGSQHRFAQAAGVTDVYISDVLHGKRGIGPSLLKHLGYAIEIRYVKK